MAMCVLGVLATSSCSKDEFFGLNEYESLDNFKKTEIALSQEYADYLIACSQITKAMDKLSDTTKVQNKGTIEGKEIAYEETGVSLIDLISKLMQAYPELAYADVPDLDDIHKIALSKNKALKGYTYYSKSNIKTRSEYFTYMSSKGEVDYPSYAQAWCGILNDWRHGHPYKTWADEDGFHFQPYDDKNSAFMTAFICGLEAHDETEFYKIGGLVFSDDSAVMVIGRGEWAEWPSFINDSYPTAEQDFCLVWNGTESMNPVDMGNRAAMMGATFNLGGRTHLFIGANGEVVAQL